MKLNSQSESTLQNYGRSICKLSLHFNKLPSEITDEQIKDYLLLLKDTIKPSGSYFKHTVYGLRYLFRLTGQQFRLVELPQLKKSKALPVVLSKQECKALFVAPSSIKHRVLLAFTYSTGLRISELQHIRLCDIDSERMQVFVLCGKGGKSRYVHLSEMILGGLRKYFRACQPEGYLFNGKNPGSILSARGIHSILKSALEKTKISKKVTLHTLRHSYATHLLEDGLDLYSIQKLLGHSHINTTLTYLHIARVSPKHGHSPLDTLYTKK